MAAATRPALNTKLPHVRDFNLWPTEGLWVTWHYWLLHLALSSKPVSRWKPTSTVAKAEERNWAGEQATWGQKQGWVIWGWGKERRTVQCTQGRRGNLGSMG